MQAHPKLCSESIVKVSSAPLSTELNGERVLLDPRSGRYFALNPVGAVIWKTAAAPTSVHAICAAIMREYEVDFENCLKDTMELIDSLFEAGLIEILDEKTA